MSVEYPDLSNTNFPESIDTFDKKSTPSSEDMQYVQQIYSKMASGDIAGAYQLMDAHPELKDSQLSALDWNKLRDAIIAIERWYQENYQEYLANNTKQIIFSDVQPDNQMLGDVWAKLIDSDNKIYEFYRCTGTGAYERLNVSVDCGTY